MFAITTVASVEKETSLNIVSRGAAYAASNCGAHARINAPLPRQSVTKSGPKRQGRDLGIAAVRRRRQGRPALMSALTPQPLALPCSARRRRHVATTAGRHGRRALLRQWDLAPWERAVGRDVRNGRAVCCVAGECHRSWPGGVIPYATTFATTRDLVVDEL